MVQMLDELDPTNAVPFLGTHLVHCGNMLSLKYSAGGWGGEWGVVFSICKQPISNKLTLLLDLLSRADNITVTQEQYCWICLSIYNFQGMEERISLVERNSNAFDMKDTP